MDPRQPTLLCRRNLHSNDGDNLNTFISGPLATRMIQLNSGRGPTQSLAVRKAIAHAIAKQVCEGLVLIVQRAIGACGHMPSKGVPCVTAAITL